MFILYMVSNLKHSEVMLQSIHSRRLAVGSSSFGHMLIMGDPTRTGINDLSQPQNLLTQLSVFKVPSSADYNLDYSPLVCGVNTGISGLTSIYRCFGGVYEDIVAAWVWRCGVKNRLETFFKGYQSHLYKCVLKLLWTLFQLKSGDRALSLLRLLCWVIPVTQHKRMFMLIRWCLSRFSLLGLGPDVCLEVVGKVGVTGNKRSNKLVFGASQVKLVGGLESVHSGLVRTITGVLQVTISIKHTH